MVVDLWADWCGPCRTLGPILEKVADERAGAFLLAKLDVDANRVGQELLPAVKSQGIPTVVAFRDGDARQHVHRRLPGAGGQRVRGLDPADGGGPARRRGRGRGGVRRRRGRRAGVPRGAREGPEERRGGRRPRADPRRARRARRGPRARRRRCFPTPRPSACSPTVRVQEWGDLDGIRARSPARSGWRRRADGARRSTAWSARCRTIATTHAPPCVDALRRPGRRRPARPRVPPPARQRAVLRRCAWPTSTTISASSGTATPPRTTSPRRTPSAIRSRRPRGAPRCAGRCRSRARGCWTSGPGPGR